MKSLSPVKSFVNFYNLLLSRFLSHVRIKLSNISMRSSTYTQILSRNLRSHALILVTLKILAIVLFGKIMVTCFHSTMHYRSNPSYSMSNDPQVVDKKRDLLNVDISQLLRHRKWSHSPVNELAIDQDFQVEELVGFVSNLDLDKTFPRKGEKENERYSDMARISDQADYEKLTTCEDLAYEAQIQHSTEPKILRDNLAEIRRHLITEESFLSREVTGDDEKEMTETEIIQKKWFQFGGSAVWLEREECFVMFSRVLYSTAHVRNIPHVSLIRAQAFDRNWIEIKGKRIRYVDINKPKDIDLNFSKIGKEHGISNCDLLEADSLAYHTCIVENSEHKLNADKRRDQLLSKYYMTYPTILEIPFNPYNDWRGPEDPHIILRKTRDYEEPVVVFNMFDTDQDRRIMIAHLPHRKIEPLVKFRIDGRQQQGVEKNWTPFFHRNIHDSSVSRGFIHFIYTFSPLEILKCSLNDGYCEIVFEAKTMQITEANMFRGIRGGTQFIPLPDVLPGVKGQQIWVGFPKQHISDCGCSSNYYRPMFSVLVENEGVYSQELVVPAIGFDMDVLAWDLKGSNCGDINILSPNSIAYWEIVNQDPKSKHFEDYLSLTMSEADFNTKVITLKGMLDFVLGIYRKKNIMDKFEISEEADSIIGHTLRCLVQSAFNSCKEYGKAHPELPDEL